MTISIDCPSCHKKLKLTDDLAGRSVKCPRCSTSIKTGAASSGSAPSKRPATAAPPAKATDEDDFAPVEADTERPPRASEEARREARPSRKAAEREEDDEE